MHLWMLFSIRKLAGMVESLNTRARTHPTGDYLGMMLGGAKALADVFGWPWPGLASRY